MQHKFRTQDVIDYLIRENTRLKEENARLILAVLKVIEELNNSVNKQQ